MTIDLEKIKQIDFNAPKFKKAFEQVEKENARILKSTNNCRLNMLKTVFTI